MLVPRRDGYILAAAFSADSRTLAVSLRKNEDSQKGEIWLVDVYCGTHEVLATGSDHPVFAVAFSPTGNLLAASEEGSASIWNLDTNRPQPFGRLPGGETFLSLTFSPDGKLIAAGGTDGAIQLWDLERNSGTVTGRASRPGVRPRLQPRRQAACLRRLGQIHLPLGHRHAPGVDSTHRQAPGPDFAHRLLPRWAFDGLERRRWRGVSLGAEHEHAVVPGMRSRRAGISPKRNGATGLARRIFTSPVQPPRQRKPTRSRWRATAAAPNSSTVQPCKARCEAKEAKTANEVCWLGSIDGFAALVKEACEQAVELASEAEKDLVRDSRGVARALTGDVAGAAEDFGALVEFLKQLPN